MAEPGAPLAGAPPVRASRLLLVGTGAVGVTFLPFWLNWLRLAYPDLEIQTVITRSAQRFVTRGALTPLAGRHVLLDEWPEEPEMTARHVELARWPELILVHPASFNFIGRLARGAGDTPVMLALQCTRAPVALAPALPPGCADAPAYRRHLEVLAERDNLVVVPPQAGYSATTRQMDAATAAPLPDVLRAAVRLRDRLERAAGAPAGATDSAPAGAFGGAAGASGGAAGASGAAAGG